MRILLVSPPYRAPNEGILAIATLRPILAAAGHEVRELHGSLDFPVDAGRLAPAWFHWNATHAFGRALRGATVEDHVDRVLASTRADLDPWCVVAPGEHLWPAYGVTEHAMREDLRAKIAAADVCLDRVVERARAVGPFDVVGVSAMFTDQIPAGVCLARRFRELWPGVKIAFGGAVCFEEQGEGLLATFPEVDAACLVEAEDVVVPLVEGLVAGDLAAVPGIAWRDGGAIRRNPSPPLLRDLDRLPVPDYDDFVRDHAASPWARDGADLFFETSRGCWWGMKSLCTFCGLNGEGLAYRAKSPARAAEEIRGLHDRYPGAYYLRAADNILDLRYLKDTLPALADLAADRARPLRMFYEVKSNMRADQIETLVAGGVTKVQPGIESFSDGVLELMRKGNTALGQIQFVKWAAEAGLEMDYNVLVLNPGEHAAWYGEMLALIPFLEHLPPPHGNITVVLERFSPYFAAPAQFGIENVRPQRSFFDFFGEDADPRLAYKFDYDHAMHRDPAHLAAVRALVAAVRRWRDGYRPDRAYYVDGTEDLLIVDERRGPARPVALAGPSAQLFALLDRNHTRAAIGRELRALEPAVVDAALETWLHRRWICRIGDRYLAVLPRKGPRAAPRVRMRSGGLPVLASDRV
jgi:ribosomal peptide maturation radical SAM protein 1